MNAFEGTTPRPWRDALTMGAIVSDDPDAIFRRGADNFRGYGGAIVCESAELPDRLLIVSAVNEYAHHLDLESTVPEALAIIDATFVAMGGDDYVVKEARQRLERLHTRLSEISAWIEATRS